MSYIGTTLPKMTMVQTLHGPAVIACCDRPVIFYESKETLEMQYLSTGAIKQIVSLAPASSADGMKFLLYEDHRGILQIGDIDGLQRL